MTLPVIGGDLQRLRRLNALAALSALRAGGPLTLTQLAERADLARATIKVVVKDLMELGWVTQLDPSGGEKGRPARRYRFRAEAGRVLGLDIGAHKVLAVVADLDGDVLHTTREQVTPGHSRAERLAAVDRVVDACLTGSNTPASDVWIAVAGSTGYVDLQGRVVLSRAIQDWAGVPLAGHLGARLRCAVLVENDSRLAALAECRRGVARDTRNLIFLHVGRRAGAAIVLDGVPLRGGGGAAAEIGAHPLFRFGHAGELLGSVPAVAPGTPPDAVAGAVFEAARRRDPDALGAVLRYVKVLALATAAMALTVDPDLVVLGGGFSRSADVLMEPLRGELATMCLRTPELRASVLGDECVAVGAVCHGVEHLSELLFDPESGPLPARPIMV
ncbi:ROK family transcriptional regulator [Nonomuraea sp. SBT364]|uniref:ROK family transcriptional regulator n=1 Tax=Nonomuraea sp. SBT364 TaxID=1580530 RepID=UPI00066AFB21|nr:ROK family transcriptional regulator [Nonomuraea sp. SBT364]